MNNIASSKEKKSPWLFAISLFVVLLLLNILLNQAANRLLSPLFDWLLLVSLPGKLVIVFLLGPFVIAIMLGVLKLAGENINYILLSVFPYSKLAYKFSVVMCSVSIIWGIINILPFLILNIWMIVVWLIAAVFIVQLNLIFLFKSRQELEAAAFNG